MTKRSKTHSRFMKRLCVIWAVAAALALAAFLIYSGQYYHADEAARAALLSDSAVGVTQTDYGWFFDGPSETDALIFYPGGKVEETAYAPMLHALAAQGMDVCLVKMPFRLAVFGMNRADDVMARHNYAHWYIGGHSLGGAMAASYAADHGEGLTGVFMLAAYPTKPLGEDLKAVVIYGSQDGVLNMANLENASSFLPGSGKVCQIQGGNHAQFGNYGAQDHDGQAAISRDEQQRETIDIILQNR